MAQSLMGVMQIISSLEVGGSETLLVDFLAACRDDDRVDFTVVVMNQAINPDLRQRLERLALNVYYLERPEGHLHPKYLIELLKIIRRHRIQLIHAHNFGSKLWAVLCKLALPSLKIIFTVHDTQSVPRMGKKQIWVHRHLIDMNIAISRKVAELCAARGIRNHKQIYNGINLRRFFRAGASKGLLPQGIGYSQERPLRILHVGRMDYPTKGQDILIDAVSRCKAQGLFVSCTLMGGVYAYNEAGFAELQERVARLGLTDNITFLTNRTDVPEQLAKADLFVLPSRYEGLGLVVLEAMAAGVPVIASDIDGPRELLCGGDNGYLFEAGNSEALLEKIRVIYENSELVEPMKQNASNFVKKFDIDVMKSQYYRLYELVLARPVTDTMPEPSVGMQASVGG